MQIATLVFQRVADNYSEYMKFYLRQYFQVSL